MECQCVPGCVYAPVNKTEDVATFSMLAASGREKRPKGNNHIEIHAVINSDKSYKGVR